MPAQPCWVISMKPSETSSRIAGAIAVTVQPELGEMLVRAGKGDARKPRVHLGLSDGRSNRAIGVVALAVASSNDVAALSPQIRRLSEGGSCYRHRNSREPNR